MTEFLIYRWSILSNFIHLFKDFVQYFGLYTRGNPRMHSNKLDGGQDDRNIYSVLFSTEKYGKFDFWLIC